MEQRVITLVGGTGFVGRYVVKLLAQAGYTVRVIARRPDAALALKTAGNVGQIVLTSGNIANAQTFAAQLQDSYAVINLAGILSESGKQTFAHVHAQGAEKLARTAKAAGVKRFIHVSALGVDRAPTSHYARSKLHGEQAIRLAFPEATILRPSLIFGPEDQFFNRFACMAHCAPALPLFGGGKTRFQPVYVMDVAKAILAALVQDSTKGETYELGGPRVYTFRELMELTMSASHHQRRLVNIPMSIAAFTGSVLQHFPSPPLTRDQVELLKYDNIVIPEAKGLVDLGIEPTGLELVVPDYLARFHRKAA